MPGSRRFPWGELLTWAVFILTCWLLLAFPAHSKPIQKTPDAKRVKQIEAALHEHGYISAGHWEWTGLQKVCRDIAQEHGWQTVYAPDARVLRILGFTSPAFDPQLPDPKDQPANPRLDPPYGTSTNVQ